MKKICLFLLIIVSIVLSMSFVSANDINETQDDVLTIDEESIIDINSGDFSSLSNYLYNDNV